MLTFERGEAAKGVESLESGLLTGTFGFSTEVPNVDADPPKPLEAVAVSNVLARGVMLLALLTSFK